MGINLVFAMVPANVMRILTLVLGCLAVHAFEHGRTLYPDADVTLNSAKYGATPAVTTGAQELEMYSDWYEVYMRWSLRELHNWGMVTKASIRLYTTRSQGPIHIYMQHLNDTTWGTGGGGGLQWHVRPRYGPIISSFKAYTKMSNFIDVTEQIQAMMTKPDVERKYFAIRMFQEGQTMVPFGAAGTWHRFASLENDDYHTRPWLEVSTDCAGCVGMDDDLNQDAHEGIDGNHGTPLDA